MSTHRESTPNSPSLELVEGEGSHTPKDFEGNFVDNETTGKLPSPAGESGDNSPSESKGTSESEGALWSREGSPRQPLNGVSETSFEHPMYVSMVKELASLRGQVDVCKTEICRLDAANTQLKADKSCDMYLVQLEAQERILTLLRKDAEESERKSAEEVAKLRQELEKALRCSDSANREKEAMVLRYAKSEQEAMKRGKELEAAEKKLRDALREVELLGSKLRGAAAEKSRVCGILDTKFHELSAAQKEVDRLREEVSARDVKIKWSTSKLQMELEAHKETQIKLEKMALKLQESREECEQVRRDAKEMVRACQESQDSKANTLDKQLKEERAALITARHVAEGWDATRRSLEERLHRVLEENNTLSRRVQALEEERLQAARAAAELRADADRGREEAAELRTRLAEAEGAALQLAHEQERLAAVRSEADRLRTSNAELQQDAAVCRAREAELLEFTQKLTEKNVRLQSEFSATEARAQALEEDCKRLCRSLAELEAREAELRRSLEEEKAGRESDTQLLARRLAERTHRTEVLAQQLEDQQGENTVLRRKQAAAIKELTRELAQTRRRMEQLESRSSEDSPSPAPSLTTPPDQPQALPEVPDRQALVERIVRLQKVSARKSEKMEFLEEHCRQLVAELQRKARLVQELTLQVPAGVLVTDAMDRNKVELSRHSGVMASMYGSRAADGAMTLELSLEINRKLQAVLEDTLLKNITLKENIETLGTEIARLSKVQGIVQKTS